MHRARSLLAVGAAVAAGALVGRVWRSVSAALAELDDPYGLAPPARTPTRPPCG